MIREWFGTLEETDIEILSLEIAIGNLLQSRKLRHNHLTAIGHHGSPNHLMNGNESQLSRNVEVMTNTYPCRAFIERR